MIKHLLIVGGVGHSTTYLYDNIARHPVYKDCLEIGVSEAELYAKIVMTHHGVSSDKIAIEKESTNCGNNASLSYEVAKAAALDYQSVLLIQDPTMQRGSYASFLKRWNESGIRWYNHAPFVPVIKQEMGRLAAAQVEKTL